MTTSHDTRPPAGTLPPAPPLPGKPPFVDDNRRLWPMVVAAAVGSAVVTIGAFAITSSRHDTPAAAPAPPPVTVTAAPPAGPAPLPVDQANRQTCQQGLLGTVAPARAASDALKALPSGMKIDDPAVRANTDWAAAVQDAGRQYQRVADTMQANIAPGTSPVLAAASNTTVKAYHALAAAYLTFDSLNGNLGVTATDTADQMAELCTRLAP